jgi:hypothetical protein
LWYLHAQPPAFNALVGIVLQLPGRHAWELHAAFLAMGLALAFTMFALMLELGTSRKLALVATLAFVVSPITVLYENFLFYSYPVALMLCAAALCFARFARTHRIAYALGFGSMLSLLALTRASFHLIVVIGAGALILIVCPRAQRRRALVAMMLPLVLVVGLYAKNTIQFGEPTSSSWFGMNLAHMMFRNSSPELRADVAANRVSRQSLIVPFVPLSRYENVVLPDTGIPALDLVSDTKHANFNNRAYIAISHRYLTDVTHFVARHPTVYLSRVAASCRIASTSAADYFAFRSNRPHIAPLVGLQNRLLGQAYDFPVVTVPGETQPGWNEVAWLVVFQYTIVAIAGAVLILRALGRRGPPLSAAQRSFVVIAVTVAYTALVNNGVELGENNRFRFETDPLVCIAAVALLSYAVRRRRRPRASHL